MEVFDNNANANETIKANADKANEADRADVAENKADKADLIIVANEVEEANETKADEAEDADKAVVTSKVKAKGLVSILCGAVFYCTVRKTILGSV